MIAPIGAPVKSTPARGASCPRASPDHAQAAIGISTPMCTCSPTGCYCAVPAAHV